MNKVLTGIFVISIFILIIGCGQKKEPVMDKTPATGDADTSVVDSDIGNLDQDEVSDDMGSLDNDLDGINW